MLVDAVAASPPGALGAVVSGAAGVDAALRAIEAELDLPQQNVSYHLKQLVDAGVIVRERRGRYSYYALVAGALNRIAALVALPEELAVV